MCGDSVQSAGESMTGHSEYHLKRTAPILTGRSGITGSGVAAGVSEAWFRRLISVEIGCSRMNQFVEIVQGS